MNEDELLKAYAKDLVLHCFRNTFLEDLHAGEVGGGSGGGFGDRDMKKLMIEVVDKVYTFLHCTADDGFSDDFKEWTKMNNNSTLGWQEPKLVDGFTKNYEIVGR